MNELDEIYFELEVFLVTWVTHNSRVSERMIDFGVKKGATVVLSKKEEVYITKTISNIVNEKKLRILAYNICRDHVHIVIVCIPKELKNIIKVLKGKTAYELNKYRQERGFVSYKHVWAQKFNRRFLETEESIYNAIEYVERNRSKHNLKENSELQRNIGGFVVDLEDIFV
jgi:REP element-mobilizing transposase RayT